MATEKILNTRIQLKYDTLTNWETKNTELKQGELAIVKIETATVGSTLQPVMFKVGPGKFNDLDWASAKAADVYGWAKKAGITVEDNGTGNVVSDIKWENDKLVITRVDVYTKAEADAKFKTQQAEYTATGSTVKTITGVSQNANGEITVAYEDIDFPDFPEIDTGIMGVEGKDAIKATTAGDVATVELLLDNTGNVELSQSTTGLKADIDLSEYRKIVDDENTAHTHVNGIGTVVEGAGGIDGEVKVNLNVAFELDNKTIKLYDKSDDKKTAIATLDATSFIKDGMLDNVSYDATTNKLTFVWNTDAGKTESEVELTDIIDPYTFTAGALIDISTEGTAVTIAHETVAAPTATTGTGRTYLTGVTTDGYGHITGYTTATEADQDLSGYKIKQTAVTDPTANGNTLAFIDTITQNENGEIAATKKNVNLADYALKTELPTVNDGKFTVTGSGSLTGTGSMTANQAEDTTATLDVAAKGITTDKVADNAIGAAQTKAIKGYTGEDAEVWVFDCGGAE